jgi:DNA repair ATPase RecN
MPPTLANLRRQEKVQAINRLNGYTKPLQMITPMEVSYDDSLAEVLEWRESLRKTTESMAEQEEIEYIHQDVQKLLQNYGFKLVPIDENSARLVNV